MPAMPVDYTNAPDAQARNDAKWGVIGVQLGVFSIVLAIFSLFVQFYLWPTRPAHLETSIGIDYDFLGAAKTLNLPLHFVWDASVGAEHNDIDLSSLRLSYNRKSWMVGG